MATPPADILLLFATAITIELPRQTAFIFSSHLPLNICRIIATLISFSPLIADTHFHYYADTIIAAIFSHTYADASCHFRSLSPLSAYFIAVTPLLIFRRCRPYMPSSSFSAFRG
jgi:hypothetical protein